MITYSIRLKKTKKKHVSRDVRKSVIGRAQSYKLSTKFKIIKQLIKISLFKRLKGKAVHFFHLQSLKLWKQLHGFQIMVCHE